MVFCKNNLEFFGLDISDLSLKIVGVRKKKNITSLVFLGAWSIPSGIITKGEINNENKLVEVIKQGLGKVSGEKINTKYVGVSLPEEKSFLDVFQIPILPEEEIENVIRQEAENNIPFPLNEVYFDFERLGQQDKKLEYQEVFSVACSKKIVDSYERVLKRVGLKPLFMEVESLAVARSIMKYGVLSDPVLIIDFGENRTSFIIFAGRHVRFTSTISVSARQLTRSIANDLKIDFRKAETMKREQGLYGDKKVFESMTPLLANLAQQIKSHLNYYHSHRPKETPPYLKKKIDKILLCGGGSNLKGLGEFLTSELKIDVSCGDAFVNIQNQKISISKGQSLGFSTAIGLALRKNGN